MITPIRISGGIRVVARHARPRSSQASWPGPIGGNGPIGTSSDQRWLR